MPGKTSRQIFRDHLSYTLKIQFEDGASQTINFRPVIGGQLYQPLRDLDFFNKAFLSDGISTLTWPNGADFNPDHLYDWPDYENLYIERVREWQELQSGQHI